MAGPTSSTQALLALLILALPVCGLSQKKKRKVPSQEKQDQALTLLKDLFKDQYKNRTKAAQQELAKLLLDKSQDETIRTDPTSYYVFLTESRRLSMKTGDLDTAASCTRSLAARYNQPARDLYLELTTHFGKHGLNAAGCMKLAGLEIELGNDLAAAEDLEGATELYESALKHGARSRSVLLVTEAKSLISKTKEEAKTAKETQAALLKLSVNPDDEDANLVYGKCLLIKGDIKSAVQHLAKSSNRHLREVAQLELEDSDDPETLISIGDAWHKCAQRSKGAFSEACRTVSRTRHKSALESLSGVKQYSLEKRLIEESPFLRAVRAGTPLVSKKNNWKGACKIDPASGSITLQGSSEVYGYARMGATCSPAGSYTAKFTTPSSSGLYCGFSFRPLTPQTYSYYRLELNFGKESGNFVLRKLPKTPDASQKTEYIFQHFNIKGISSGKDCYLTAGFKGRVFTASVHDKTGDKILEASCPKLEIEKFTLCILSYSGQVKVSELYLH